ncbi:MAG TPA: 3-phosphoshikimate 1-carboxyvinyltransferase [Candidatus Acidoferrum sp.]|nr:3-phosphoshikimate 1-carboxyvinyltransferase [Candidatus Acidoferrum sp.]
MPLPDLIEITPLTGPVRAEITVPGSKSITNRALVLAALADGAVTLEGALWSEDTQVMVNCLRRLGFDASVAPDPNEFCNRTISVQGRGGEIPRAGAADAPLELFVGNAGTAARFLAALVCLGRGVYRLSGVPRMHERPQAALFSALRELGYRVEAENENDKLPALIFGRRNRGNETLTEESQRLLTSSPTEMRKARVSIEASSQFASALLLCAERGGWQIEVVGENAEESPYVWMTTKMIKVFPKRGGNFQIEPDASSGSYFWGAGWLLGTCEFASFMKEMVQNSDPGTQRTVATDFAKRGRSNIRVASWPESEWQKDADFTIFATSPVRSLAAEISRTRDLADSIMTAIAIAPFASSEVRFTDLGRLRLQECERVVALRTELTRCGAKVIETGDTLEVFPSRLHGAEIETYNDHRMAMCFAVLGLKVPGIKLRNPSCVKKTFPNFFQKLAAAPPHGLGVEIRDGHTGRRLTHEELFAD